MRLSVDTKSVVNAAFGNDSVGIKSGAGDVFGNAAALSSYRNGRISQSGNDAIGFIRVRKRPLKVTGWRYCRDLIPQSWSFDLVRAVRVGGKPRHHFVLGLASQKQNDRHTDNVWFWERAIFRMTRHGLSGQRRQHLIAEMVRKGARLPSVEKCEKFVAEIAEFARGNIVGRVAA